MKLNTYKILTFALLPLTAVLLYNLNRANSQIKLANENLESQMTATDNAFVELSNARQLQFGNWYQDLQGFKEGMKVTDLEGKELPLESVVNNKMFVFHFASDMCQSCIEKEFRNLKTLSDQYGIENITILSQGYRANFLKRSSDFRMWKNQMFTVEENIFKQGEIIYTPSLAFLENNDIKLVYHAPKASNESFEFLIQAVDEYVRMQAATINVGD